MQAKLLLLLLLLSFRPRPIPPTAGQTERESQPIPTGGSSDSSTAPVATDATGDCNVAKCKLQLQSRGAMASRSEGQVRQVRTANNTGSRPEQDRK